jgi:hypothetical protein
VTSALLAGAVLLALVFHLRHLVRRSSARAAEAATAELASILAVVADARGVPSGTAGVTTFAGSWNGHHVQIRTIVDTLATRKLPALWLSVTIAEKVRVPAIFDLMMRPGSATTFSNFDHLPRTLATPADYPEGAVIRTDGDAERQPLEIIGRHLGVFADGRAKELLITENGIRIVWLLAEADRARYGVFRQAEFSGANLDPALINALLAEASSLRAAINRDALKVAA